MKNHFPISNAIVLLLILHGTSLSAPVSWLVGSGGNGNYYEVVDGYSTWVDAQVAASSRMYAGLQGRLATIGSAAEEQFLVDTFGVNALRLHLLGGYQDSAAPDYLESAGGWRWITGEPWGYTNWGTGDQSNTEPNNGLGFVNENRLEFSNSGLGWNDIIGADVNTLGYVVEYSVPEPATLTMWAAIGSLAICRCRKSRRKGLTH